MFIGPCIIAIVQEWKPTWCHLLFYFNYYALNMFRTLIYPSSGASDFVDELPHRSSCSQFVVCCSFCRGWYLVVFVLQVEALVLQSATRTPPNISHSKNCSTQRTENKTTDVVIHQQSCWLLKMDILMSETCWAHNNWNKIRSDIKLVFIPQQFRIHLYSIRKSFNTAAACKMFGDRLCSHSVYLWCVVAPPTSTTGVCIEYR